MVECGFCYALFRVTIRDAQLYFEWYFEMHLGPFLVAFNVSREVYFGHSILCSIGFLASPPKDFRLPPQVVAVANYQAI